MVTRDAFKTHVQETIEGVICDAEKRVCVQLGRRYCFNWMGAKSEPVPEGQVVEFITQHVYIDPDHIYPCVDIGVGDILDDGRLLLIGGRAGYPPCEWRKNWTGREGPFVPIMGQKLLDKFPDLQHRDMVRAARDILAGRTGIVEGARKLRQFRFSSLLQNDPDILAFVGIASEADSFPLGGVRRKWNTETLKNKDEELRLYESRVRQRAFQACERIISKFAVAD